ncbi:MAG: aminotransferase class I/II-fold pyridoxal phosphate-dependent enzyme [Clostridia bacterium]|nr:aminotransferase class I/II-fold pyridoxal phosphate-dependent enzyme [Clostridia bacterium]
MKKIYLSSPNMGGDELYYIQDAFEKNWIAPLGENVDEFEKEVAKRVDCNFCVALSSGTATVHMALKAAGVEQGDIVFCPSLTFAASANPIIYQGATPVFIDCDEDNWNMSPVALQKAFEKYPNPKAVIVVHIFGQAAKLDEIVEICKKHNTVLIEDAAESLGTTYKGKETGTFGKYGVFSFNGNKIITTSGGGMLVCENEDTANKVKFWITQARDNERYYQHTEIGYNYRMSNILAGIGRGQLKVLDTRIKQKTDIYNRYKKAFEEISAIKMIPVTDYSKPNFWLTCITINKNANIAPLDIILALEKENIESRYIWKPLHLQPVFEKYDFFTECENGSYSEEIFKYGVCLPSDTNMTLQEQDRVIEIVKSLFNK